jgi:hypothetical protein
MNKSRISTLLVLILFGFKAVAGLAPLEFQKAIQGKMILAPLLRGGNLPFRRLYADFGMD